MCLLYPFVDFETYTYVPYLVLVNYGCDIVVKSAVGLAILFVDILLVRDERCTLKSHMFMGISCNRLHDFGIQTNPYLLIYNMPHKYNHDSELLCSTLVKHLYNSFVVPIWWPLYSCTG